MNLMPTPGKNTAIAHETKARVFRDVQRSSLCDPTRPDQLRMVPKVEISKCSINILRVVDFIFKSVQSLANVTCAKSMRSELQNKTENMNYFKKTKVFFKHTK